VCVVRCRICEVVCVRCYHQRCLRVCVFRQAVMASWQLSCRLCQFDHDSALLSSMPDFHCLRMLHTCGWIAEVLQGNDLLGYAVSIALYIRCLCLLHFVAVQQVLQPVTWAVVYILVWRMKSSCRHAGKGQLLQLLFSGGFSSSSTRCC
jgi:hypothetical protein